ncbi:MAG: hypothetical protein ACHQET_12260 [Chitinophagales bacterium]
MLRCVAFSALLVLAGCRGKQDFSVIKKGMKSSEVIQLVGTPMTRRSMQTSDWWLYNDPNKHIIVMGHDTVIICTTQEQASKIMEENLRSIDSAELR